jgi:hypothetical protein
MAKSGAVVNTWSLPGELESRTQCRPLASAAVAPTAPANLASDSALKILTPSLVKLLHYRQNELHRPGIEKVQSVLAIGTVDE